MGGVPLVVDGRMRGRIGKTATGVRRYAETLIVALEAANVQVQVLEDGGGAARRTRAGLWASAVRPGARRLRSDRPGLLARDIFREAHVHFSLYRRLLTLRCGGPRGVVHWTYPLPLRVEGWRNLYTVHDAIPLTDPELTPIDARRHREVLRRIAETAERIVTVSEAARSDIVGAIGCPADLVAARWQAIGDDVAGDVPLPAPLERGRFLLFWGAIEPRKNLTRLIEAYRASGVTLPLVLAGPAGWRAAEIEALASRTPGVLRLPYQDRLALIALIAAARALLFPSLAEGFGLPVAEAMALGTPVLTSDRGALREIAGDACLLIPPEDVAAIAAGIVRLAGEDALRATLRARGLARAGLFDRASYAQWLLNLYVGGDDRQ